MHQIINLFKNPITYKILIDIFLIMLLVTGGFVISETLLPGVIGAYISPFILFVITFLITIVISFITRKQSIHAPIKKPNKVLFILSLLLFTIFISVASFGYGYFFGSLIILFSISIFILLYSLIQDLLNN